MGKTLKFKFEPTGIGSVPFKDVDTAVRTILKDFENIPFWPQLPKGSFLENMYVQFSERLPGLVIDINNKTAHVDSAAFGAQMEEVFGKCLDKDVDYFAVSRSHAQGFFRFLELAALQGKNFKFVKGQMTGPISCGLFLADENKKALIYDKDMFEVLTKVFAMKARWQVRMLKRIHPSVILFMDEPYLTSIGSSFVNINMEQAFAAFAEVASAIRDEGALCGTHCCGNTDWSSLLKQNIDILNFDAYQFMREFTLYYSDIASFLKRGGTIAWGIVPSSDAINSESADMLAGRLVAGLAELERKGIARADISSLITSSCGVGTLDEKIAEKVLETTVLVSKRIQSR